MSTRNFIGFGQNSAHSLRAIDAEIVGYVAYLIRVNTANRVTRLHANGIYARDERHAMILVSWTETFIFHKRCNYSNDANKICNNIFYKWITPIKCKNNKFLRILNVVDVHHSKLWMPIHYATIEDGKNKKSHLLFSKLKGLSVIASG